GARRAAGRRPTTLARARSRARPLARASECPLIVVCRRLPWPSGRPRTPARARRGRAMTTTGPFEPARKAGLEEVLADYMERLDRGEVVNRGRLLAEYPHLAEELQSYFADSDAVALLRRGEQPLLPGTDAPPAPAGPPAAPGTTVRYVGDYELLEE